MLVETRIFPCGGLGFHCIVNLTEHLRLAIDENGKLWFEIRQLDPLEAISDVNVP